MSIDSLTSDHIINFCHHYLTPAIFGTIVIIGIFGNSLVLLVICFNRTLRNCTNILIASLACADLAFLILCVPLTADIYVKRGWRFSESICRMYIYFTYLTVYMSVYTLLLMSIDRYLAVVHPILSLSIRTEYNAVKAVIGTWLLFSLSNSPLLINSGLVYGPNRDANNQTIYYCSYKPLVYFNMTTNCYLKDNLYSRKYYTLFLIFGFCLPLTGIVVLYRILVYKLLYNNSSTINQSTRALKSKKRVTRMVVIVVITFAICWCPIQTVFIIQVFDIQFIMKYKLAFRFYHIISNSMAYSNSMINPILYAFYSQNFRTAFRNLLCCQRYRANEETQFGGGEKSRYLIQKNNTIKDNNNNNKKISNKLNEHNDINNETNCMINTIKNENQDLALSDDIDDNNVNINLQTTL